MKSSVTRLSKFSQFLPTNVHTKVVQKFRDFLGFSGKHDKLLRLHFGQLFRKIWANFIPQSGHTDGKRKIIEGQKKRQKERKPSTDGLNKKLHPWPSLCSTQIRGLMLLEIEIRRMGPKKPVIGQWLWLSCRPVASDSRSLQFESSHWQTFIQNVCLLLKDKNKEKSS